MPDLPRCIYSPFLTNPSVVGAAMATGIEKYCFQINPLHKDFDPGVAGRYVEMSLNLMESAGGIPVDRLAETMSAKIKARLDTLGDGIVMKPSGGGGKPTKPHKPPKAKTPLRTVADDSTHERVYEAARDCPHKLKAGGCCGSEKCGPTGEHPGTNVDIQFCYACSIVRLNVSAG